MFPGYEAMNSSQDNGPRPVSRGLHRFYWSDGYRPHIFRRGGRWLVSYYPNWTRRIEPAIKFAEQLNNKF